MKELHQKMQRAILDGVCTPKELATMVGVSEEALLRTLGLREHLSHGTVRFRSRSDQNLQRHLRVREAAFSPAMLETFRGDSSKQYAYENQILLEKTGIVFGGQGWNPCKDFWSPLMSNFINGRPTGRLLDKEHKLRQTLQRASKGYQYLDLATQLMSLVPGELEMEMTLKECIAKLRDSAEASKPETEAKTKQAVADLHRDAGIEDRIGYTREEWEGNNVPSPDLFAPDPDEPGKSYLIDQKTDAALQAHVDGIASSARVNSDFSFDHVRPKGSPLGSSGGKAEPPGSGGYINQHNVRVPNPCCEIDDRGRNMDLANRHLMPNETYDQCFKRLVQMGEKIMGLGMTEPPSVG